MVDRAEVKPLTMTADRAEVQPGLVDHLDPVYVQPEHPPWVQVLGMQMVRLVLGIDSLSFPA